MLDLDFDKIYLKPSLPKWKICQVHVRPKTQSQGPPAGLDIVRITGPDGHDVLLLHGAGVNRVSL